MVRLSLIVNTFTMLMLNLYSQQIASTTVIDVLSTLPKYKNMIYLLQESRMIPTINRSKNITLLALTNDNLENLEKLYPTRKDKEMLVRYHMLEGRFNSTQLKKAYQRQSDLIETWLDRDIPDSAPFGEGHGQVIRVKVERKLVFDVFSFNGVKLVDYDLEANNGVVHTVDGYINPPPSLENVLNDNKELSIFNSLLKMTDSIMEKVMDKNKPCNLFIWDDLTLKNYFKKTELDYLLRKHEWSDQDRFLVVGSAVVGTMFNPEDPPVLYTQLIDSKHPIYTTNLAGDPIAITFNDHINKATYNGIPVRVKNILTSNGVVHILSRALSPPGLEFTALKYLVGMNSTKFARIASRPPLNKYFVHSVKPYTILVPSDEHLEDNDPRIVDQLRYHIIPGHYDKESFNNSKIVSTVFSPDVLEGQQKIKVELEDKTLFFNRQSAALGDFVLVDRTTLFKLTKPLNLPPAIDDLISQDPEFSAFNRLFKLSGRGSKLNEKAGVTALLPSNKAFEQHGQQLLMNLLLQQGSLPLLQNFIDYHIVSKPVYSIDIEAGTSVKYPTWLKNNSLTINHNSSGRFNLQQASYEIESAFIETDLMVENGVVHKVSALAIPPNHYLDINARVLIGSSDFTIFLSLLETTNMTHLLTNSEGAGTVLVPTNAAWNQLNLTELINDQKTLLTTLQMHFLLKRTPLKLSQSFRAFASSTLAQILPDLEVVFSKTRNFTGVFNTYEQAIVVGLRGQPLPMFNWQAKVIGHGQAHNLAIVVVDTVLLLQQDFSLHPFLKFLIYFFSFGATISLTGFLAFMAYRRGYFAYLLSLWYGYEPITE